MYDPQLLLPVLSSEFPGVCRNNVCGFQICFNHPFPLHFLSGHLLSLSVAKQLNVCEQKPCNSAGVGFANTNYIIASVVRFHCYIY